MVLEARLVPLFLIVALPNSVWVWVSSMDKDKHLRSKNGPNRKGEGRVVE